MSWSQPPDREELVAQVRVLRDGQPAGRLGDRVVHLQGGQADARCPGQGDAVVGQSVVVQSDEPVQVPRELLDGQQRLVGDERCAFVNGPTLEPGDLLGSPLVGPVESFDVCVVVGLLRPGKHQVDAALRAHGLKVLADEDAAVVRAQARGRDPREVVFAPEGVRVGSQVSASPSQRVA